MQESTFERAFLATMVLLAGHMAFPSAAVTPAQAKFAQGNMCRVLLVFTASYMASSTGQSSGTYSVGLSLVVTAVYFLLQKVVLNENSRFNVIPRWFSEDLPRPPKAR